MAGVGGVTNNTNTSTNVTNTNRSGNSNSENFSATLTEAEKKKIEEERQKKLIEDGQRLRNGGLTDKELKDGVIIDSKTGKKIVPKKETIEDLQRRKEAIEKESKKRKDPYSKDTFLQLLVTQMKHQDPLEPMNNEQMLAQMAQFSTVEQLTNLNSSFSDFKKDYEKKSDGGANSDEMVKEIKKLNENMKMIIDNFGITHTKDESGNPVTIKGEYLKQNDVYFFNIINRLDALENEIKKLAQ